jgi:hypothetical protein
MDKSNARRDIMTRIGALEKQKQKHLDRYNEVDVKLRPLVKSLFYRSKIVTSIKLAKKSKKKKTPRMHFLETHPGAVCRKITKADAGERCHVTLSTKYCVFLNAKQKTPYVSELTAGEAWREALEKLHRTQLRRKLT